MASVGSSLSALASGEDNEVASLLSRPPIGLFDELILAHSRSCLRSLHAASRGSSYSGLLYQKPPRLWSRPKFWRTTSPRPARGCCRETRSDIFLRPLA